MWNWKLQKFTPKGFWKISVKSTVPIMNHIVNGFHEIFFNWVHFLLFPHCESSIAHFSVKGSNITKWSSKTNLHFLNENSYSDSKLVSHFFLKKSLNILKLQFWLNLKFLSCKIVKNCHFSFSFVKKVDLSKTQIFVPFFDHFEKDYNISLNLCSKAQML